jgi:SAM-dependent methyltransferase
LTGDAGRIAWWQVCTDPTFIARSRLRRAVAALASQLSLSGRGIWLDLGCGSRPYESLFAVERYIGLDVLSSGHPPDAKRHDLLFDGANIPVRADSVDGVLCTQVLEHTAEPAALLKEIRRVLKPGGVLVMTAPFVWEEHEQPYDFFRYTEFGLRHLLEANGLKVKTLLKTSGTIETLAQACSNYAANNLRLPVRGFGRVVTALICAPVQIAGLLAQALLPDERNLYLDHAVLAYKNEPKSADGERR